MDLRKDFPDIRVSLVMPGVVATEFRKNVIGGSTSWQPGQASILPQAQTAEEVAEAIASLIEHPRSEIYTNPASEAIARRYREDIEAFEEGMLK
jgi:short-subunit dehydrogenase